MHEYTDDGMRSPTPSVPIAVSTLSTHVFPACNANTVQGTRNCLHTPYCVCRSPSMVLISPYVAGRYRHDNWDPDCPGPSTLFVPLAAVMLLLGDVFDSRREQDAPESVPCLRRMPGAAPSLVRGPNASPAVDCLVRLLAFLRRTGCMRR